MTLEGQPNMTNQQTHKTEDADGAQGLEAGQMAQTEMESPGMEVRSPADESTARSVEISRVAASIESARERRNAAREKLGLDPVEADPPNTAASSKRLAGLEAEHAEFEKRRSEIASQEERARLIEEEKQKILQERLDALFKEFIALPQEQIQYIATTGRMAEGRAFESPTMGSLEAEVAQPLAKAFIEGIKLLPDILKAAPDLLKKLDEDLTKEATERVEKKLEEERLAIEEAQKVEAPENEAALEEAKAEAGIESDAQIESSKAD